MHGTQDLLYKRHMVGGGGLGLLTAVSIENPNLEIWAAADSLDYIDCIVAVYTDLNRQTT